MQFKAKVEENHNKKEFFPTLAQNIYKSYLAYKQIQSDPNRKSLKLSNNYPSLYSKLDNFPKNVVEVVVLFCPPQMSIEITYGNLNFYQNKNPTLTLTLLDEY